MLACCGNDDDDDDGDRYRHHYNRQKKNEAQSQTSRTVFDFVEENQPKNYLLNDQDVKRNVIRKTNTFSNNNKLNTITAATTAAVSPTAF